MENKEYNSVEEARAEQEPIDALFAFDEQPTVDNENIEQEETAPEEALSVPEEAQKGEEQIDDSVKAYRKLQSEKDKALAEAEKLRKELEEMRDYLPLARYFKENPQLLDEVGKKLFNPEQTEPVQQEKVLEKPVKPKKPENYSRYEALNDPDSESAKYEEAMVEYNERLADYLEQVSQKKVNEIEQFKEELSKTERERQEREALKQLQIELKSQYGFNDTETEKFIEYMSQYRPTVEDMVALYKQKTKPNISEEELRSKAEIAKKKAQAPLPAGMGESSFSAPNYPKGYRPPVSDDALFGLK